MKLVEGDFGSAGYGLVPMLCIFLPASPLLSLVKWGLSVRDRVMDSKPENNFFIFNYVQVSLLFVDFQLVVFNVEN